MFATIAKLALAVSAFAGLATSTTYANFCDDGECALNCGESVSVDNPGCLTEYNRQSVKFHDINVQNVALVFSPDPNCSCQHFCIQNMLEPPAPYSPPGCVALTGPTTQSYRFVGGGGCDPNNCT